MWLCQALAIVPLPENGVVTGVVIRCRKLDEDGKGGGKAYAAAVHCLNIPIKNNRVDMRLEDLHKLSMEVRNYQADKQTMLDHLRQYFPIRPYKSWYRCGCTCLAIQRRRFIGLTGGESSVFTQPRPGGTPFLATQAVRRVGGKHACAGQ